MRLVVSSGSSAGRAFELGSRLVVGRDEGCDLVLEDERVSRRHCVFAPNPDGTVALEDLGSANGTFVGGERVAGPVVLRGGEEVRVGSTVLRVEGGRGAGATVVGAPATVAGSPASGSAPALPPGDGGSWWRSRWVLVGAVAVLVAVGGIVGGVLAVTGGGGDEPVSLVTTDGGTSEPETVTVTEPGETEPPPETETGGVETGGVETVGDVLSTAQQQLLAVVPAAIQPACAGYEPREPDLRGGLVAGLRCTLPDGLVVLYVQYDSNESMDAAYFSDYVNPDQRRDEGDCSDTFPGEGTYSVGDETAGRLFCFMGGEPVGPIIYWTTDALGVLGTVNWEGHTDRELYEFWTSEPGPNV